MENNEIVIGVIAALIVVLIAVGFIVMLVAHSNRKSILHNQEKENLELQYRQQTLLAQTEIQEQTLQQISKELHDNFGQLLSVIKINLTALQKKPEAGENNRLILEDSIGICRQLIGDIKALSVSLNSERLTRAGFLPALELEVNRLNRTGNFMAYFTETGLRPVIDSGKVTILFRMCQEIINNIVKHSQADDIHITSSLKDNLYILAISDNGRGFDQEEAIRKGGAGLDNLQKRARLLHAGLVIHTSPGNGTTITIQLPV